MIIPPDHRECVSRREALRVSVLGAAGFALFRSTGLGAIPPLKPGPAKSVIQIWMWGGPCHLDTFDPKPDAGNDYCGPFRSPIATKVDGLRVNELLPMLADQADKYSVLRGMTHGNNGHETASYIVQTGHEPGRLVYPTVGAVVARLRGYDNGYKGLLPPYIVLTTPQGRFSEAGFLGPKYKPFATGGDPAQKLFVVEGVVAAGIPPERQRARRELLHKLDALGDAMPSHPEFQQLDLCEEKAYEMILGDAGKIFDLETENPAVRERYGRNSFGQSCLMARRLVEAGVPYITINYKGWDTHKQHFDIMRRKLPEMDRGMATLIADLSERGLLGSTIVWWSGEFGRTPKVQYEPPWNGGRGHFGRVFSSLIAGGGFAGGHVLGATDRTGEELAERPIYPPDLIASMVTKLGIDPDGPLPNPMGLDLKVMPTAAGPDSPRGGMLKEIM